MEKDKLYKPLPDGLTIEKSKVQGLGLFTQFFVKKGTNFGVSHMKMNGMLIRTPLGGFINHSDEPNCEKVKLQAENYTKYNLITIKNIKAWEELTVKYTFYNMGSNGKNLSVSEKLQNELEPIVNAPMMETE